MSNPPVRPDPTALVQELGLVPHPEGGFYRETYRSSESIPEAGLPARFQGERSLSTAIYFLLGPGDFSAFHRIRSDETWHYYTGSCGLDIHVISSDGSYRLVRLGARSAAGETFQATIPAGAWFASEPSDPAGFALVGCTVAPGFDFRDFEMASADTLAATHPDLAELVQRRCR
jgi:predicted cupin superfamily sugar epimerase